MLGPNATLLNTTTEDTSLLASLLPSLDYSQLLYQPQCPGWVPLNHVYYQVFNLFLLLSSIATNSRGGFLFL
jgi:hypothetical protein